MESSIRIDTPHCWKHWSSDQRRSRRFRSDLGSLYGSRKDFYHHYFDSYVVSLFVIDTYSSGVNSLSIEHGEQVKKQEEEKTGRCSSNCSSWRNEFRQWIGDLEPTIPVYLFSADDVPKKDRVQFLRRVSSTWIVVTRVVVSLFASGMKVVAFSSWAMKCIVYWIMHRMKQ